MEKNANPQWQRIEEVTRWANMSANLLARKIGLARGEALYRIKRGNNGISRALAERIVACFPEISKTWLLTGEGVMFARPQEAALVPFYEADVETQLREVEQLRPTCELDIPLVTGCELAMRYTSRAMEPLIPCGAVVLLQKVTLEAIIPNREYVIITQNLVTLRCVRRDANELYWRLTPANREEFDDMVVRDEEIRAIYAVRGRLILDQ